MHEVFGDIIRCRIDKVTPICFTLHGRRQPPHYLQLEESDAEPKIPFLVSDGRRQDHGYGRY